MSPVKGSRIVSPKIRRSRLHQGANFKIKNLSRDEIHPKYVVDRETKNISPVKASRSTPSNRSRSVVVAATKSLAERRVRSVFKNQ